MLKEGWETLFYNQLYSSNFMKPEDQSPPLIGQQTTAWHTSNFDLSVITQLEHFFFVI